MKIAPRNITGFVNAPDKHLAVILIYGPNTGLVREYGAKLAKQYVEDINDPFNVATFTAASIIDDPAKFRDETASISLMGGQRLILIKDSADNITPYIKEFCEDPTPECTIIIEAAEMKPSSPLRKLCEGHDKAAALACYLEEERNIGGKIREICQHAGYGIEHDSLRLLSEVLAGDSALLRSEVEKLILYKGLAEDYEGFDGEPLRRKIGDITVQDVLACNPNMRDYSLDDLIAMTAMGQERGAHALTQKMLAEGLPPIAIFRALLRHFRRLQITIARMQDGEDVKTAMKKLKPPVFFKFERDFMQQSQKWPLKTLSSVITKIVDDEAESKKGAQNAETLCLHLVLNISRIASKL